MNEKIYSIDYDKALELVHKLPKYYLGQEVETEDGKGIIVDMRMDFNGLYIQPSTSRVIVWFSTMKAFEQGITFVNKSYNLLEISPANNH